MGFQLDLIEGKHPHCQGTQLICRVSWDSGMLAYSFIWNSFTSEVKPKDFPEWEKVTETLHLIFENWNDGLGFWPTHLGLTQDYLTSRFHFYGFSTKLVLIYIKSQELMIL